MSNAIFPSLIGLAWNVTKRPEFNTKVHRSVSGMEARAALMAYPLWTFQLSYEVLRDGGLGSDYDQLVGFFVARNGSFDSFLYIDPTDSSVIDQQIGIGDGVTTKFQLLRGIGAISIFQEPINNVNSLTNVKDNGTVVSSSNYTINSSGLVTFNTAPASGHVITWTGTYYYRCRFAQDIADFNLMITNLWELKKLEFVGSTMNKV